MNKKIIILFSSFKENLNLKKSEREEIKKNFSQVVLFKGYKISECNNLKFNKKKLNNIKKNYYKLGINLSLKKIYLINSFLEKISIENNNKEIFVSPYFISGVISEEEFIFFEVSKIYKMSFVRPELSFIKNRYILSKNLFKHYYNLKKKTIFTKKKFKTLKKNYISSLDIFVDNIKLHRKKKSNYFCYKVLLKILSIFYKFRFDERPKKYVLAILGNDTNLNLLSQNSKLKEFVNKFFKKFNYKLVFLVHPNTNIINLLRNYIKSKNIFFKSDQIVFLQKPKNLSNIIENSEFIVHLTSSLSAQILFLKKRILCFGKNIIYLNNFNNLISNFDKDNFNFLRKKIYKKDIVDTDKFLRNVLSNSVDNKGKFELSSKKGYYSLTLKRNELKIIQSLLNAI